MTDMFELADKLKELRARKAELAEAFADTEARSAELDRTEDEAAVRSAASAFARSCSFLSGMTKMNSRQLMHSAKG